MTDDEGRMTKDERSPRSSFLDPTSFVRRHPSYVLLALIVAAYVGLAAGYAVATPRWNNPDEPAHYNYVRQIADTGRLPILREGDWDAELLERLKAARFPDDAAIRPIRYESHQPPLYYLLGAGVYLAAVESSLRAHVLALKGLSIVLSIPAILSAYVLGRYLWFDRPSIALLAAATVAFVPMHTAISAAVNNDSLANALAAVTLVALAIGLRRGFDDAGAIGLGLLIGALLLAKVTVYAYVPLALATVVWWELRTTEKGERSWSVVLRRPALAIAAAGSISSWWFVRNGLLYGWTDPLASARHAEVVIGQPQWAQLDLMAAAYFAQVLFRSFWGQFGWMGVVLDDRTYLFYLGLTLLAMAGLGIAAWDAWRRRRACVDMAKRREILVMVVSALALVLAGIVMYNLTFIQPQGRYLFPALVPIALLLALGWWRLADLVASLTPWRSLVERGLLLGLGIGLGLLNLFCLVRFVAPAFR